MAGWIGRPGEEVHRPPSHFGPTCRGGAWWAGRQVACRFEEGFVSKFIVQPLVRAGASSEQVLLGQPRFESLFVSRFRVALAVLALQRRGSGRVLAMLVSGRLWLIRLSPMTLLPTGRNDRWRRPSLPAVAVDVAAAAAQFPAENSADQLEVHRLSAVQYCPSVVSFTWGSVDNHHFSNTYTPQVRSWYVFLFVLCWLDN
jgi:hypothetical protein